MLEKFRKLEERLFSLENETEIVDTESEITFCNPSTIEKPCKDCEFNSKMKLTWKTIRKIIIRKMNPKTKQVKHN